MTTTTISATKNTDLGYDRITVSVGDDQIGWLHRWNGERQWTLYYRGEEINKISKAAGIEWLLFRAERMF